MNAANTDGKTARVDLHTHTTASDGTLTPSDLVRAAAQAGLAAVAVTDHDSVDGVAEALEAGARYGITVVPGIELSTEYAGVEIHVVGLFVDHASEELNRQARRFRDERDTRNRKMIERLQNEGFSITEEELYARFPDSVVARPHMARFLYETGQAKSVKAVFDRYIGDQCSCYVHRDMITPMQAVRIIREAKGVAVLAHPCLYKKLPEDRFYRMMDDLKAAGLDGMEVRYSRNTAKQDAYYQTLADRYGLLYSGGSDFHGSNKPDISLGTGTGDLFVPEAYLDQIRNRRNGKV